MEWTVLNFGKHRGKTFPQIMFSDPDYFFWAYDTGVFNDRPLFRHEANDINRKARNIRIPSKGGQDLVAEYFIHPVTRKFGSLEIVQRSQPQHSGASATLRKDVIDLSFPRTIAQYDKKGSRSLLREVKYYIFGDRKFRMTQERCQNFFSDSSNFI